MEWITHTATGFFVGQAMVKPDERPRRAGWWWAIAAISPDWLEVATTWFGDIHRGVTHSLYMWPVLALAWALAARRWGGKQVAAFTKLWIAFFAILGSHLLLDIMMSYRLYFAWPFSNANGAFGIMPFYDLYIFAGWVLLMIIHHWRNLSSAMTAKIGLAIFLVMFTLRTAGKVRTQQLAEQMVANQSERIVTRPTYYQPWILYARSSATLPQWTPINVFSGERISHAEIIRRWFPRIPYRKFFRRHG